MNCVCYDWAVWIQFHNSIKYVDYTKYQIHSAGPRESTTTLWPLWWLTLLSIRVQTRLKHILICLLPQYQHQRNVFFRAQAQRGIVRQIDVSSVVWTHQQWQIDQSDCEFSSRYGKSCSQQWYVSSQCSKCRGVTRYTPHIVIDNSTDIAKPH